MRHDLYRLYRWDGALAYVGMSSNVASRLLSHKTAKPWWPEIDLTRLRLEEFSSREELAGAEARAIMEEQPLYNVTGTGRPRPRPVPPPREPVLSILVTAQDIVEMAGVSIETVYKWHAKGGGPRIAKIGKRLMAYRSEVEEWTADRRSA